MAIPAPLVAWLATGLKIAKGKVLLVLHWAILKWILLVTAVLGLLVGIFVSPLACFMMVAFSATHILSFALGARTRMSVMSISIKGVSLGLLLAALFVPMVAIIWVRYPDLVELFRSLSQDFWQALF